MFQPSAHDCIRLCAEDSLASISLPREGAATTMTPSRDDGSDGGRRDVLNLINERQTIVAAYSYDRTP